MAEEAGQLRTEEPTPRRREEARKQGQVAFSPELTAAAVVLAGVLFLMVTGDRVGSRLLEAFRTDLRHVPAQELGVGEAQELGGRLFGRLAGVLGGLFAVAVAAAIGVAVAQLGFRMLPQGLTPDLHRVSPVAGFNRLFSAQSAK